MSQILHLSDNNIELTLVCGSIEPDFLKLLKSKNVNVIITGNKRRFKSILGKIESYLKYRFAIKKIDFDEKSILWISTADSGIGIIDLIRNKQFILNSLELYDGNKLYFTLMSRLARLSKVVIVNEKNRAGILRVLWKLKSYPIVMPNKPYTDQIEKSSNPLRIENLNTNLDLIKKLDNIVLYQGLVSRDRSLKNLAKALNYTENRYNLVIMGPLGDSKIKLELENEYENIYFLDPINPPYHLEITKLSKICILSYDYTDLNNLYCAPNKIYEYSKYGKPMIGNDVLGLQNTIGYNDAGITVDYSDSKLISEAIDKIEKRYDYYSLNSISFYNATDNNQLIKNILKLVGVTSNDC